MAAPTKSDGGTSSSAETAREIKSHLAQLRKSSRQRKKRGGGSGNDRDDAPRLDELRRTFARLIERREFDSNAGAGGNGGAGSLWKEWLATQHDAFVTHLVDAVVAGRTTALRTFCGVVASSPVDVVGPPSDDDANGSSDEAKRSDGGMVSERLLNKLLEACVKSRRCLHAAYDDSGSSDNDESNVPREEDECYEENLAMEEAMLTLLESEFVRPHRDVQYFVYKGLHQIALDLLGGLDRLRKRAERKVAALKGENKSDADGSDKESLEDGDDAVAKAERNAGVVAENMCRLLMMIDYVPKNQGDLMDESGFLYPPPVLYGNDDEGDEDGDVNHGAIEEDSEEDDDSSDASDSSEDEEEEKEAAMAATKKRKKQITGSGGNKRSKKTKLIAWQKSYKHRHAHQEAWLSVLRLPSLPSRTQKRVLQHLSTYVLKTCPSPLRFAEYFTRSFRGGSAMTGAAASSKAGGISNNDLTAILSLDGLFILMLDHQLEYPQFYNSLYALLRPRILYTKHRTRFLRLLSRALLSNPMLPAYVVASYCKRLCRLALNAPPSGGLFVLALVSNLLRKHGECACLIHRGGTIDEDVFVEEVDDLAKTRALESSLWELAALERHYHPAISTLAKSVGTEDDKTTPMHDVEDFLAHTYKSLFEQEKKRLGGGGSGGVNNKDLGGGKKKKGGGGRVSLTFVEPTGLFTKDDVFGDFFKCS